MKVVDLPKKSTRDAVKLLEEWLEQARNGEFENVSLMAYRTDKTYQTGASSTTDNTRDVALLFDLAIRRMGFIKENDK